MLLAADMHDKSVDTAPTWTPFAIHTSLTDKRHGHYCHYRQNLFRDAASAVSRLLCMLFLTDVLKAPNLLVQHGLDEVPHSSFALSTSQGKSLAHR